jgi:very-short-patch-repair endonuclease
MVLVNQQSGLFNNYNSKLMSLKTYNRLKSIRSLARAFRRDATESERLVWKELRDRQLSGYKILRQHPLIYSSDYTGMHYFIADFYCHAKKTVIELDGPVHQEQLEYDKFRDEVMAEKGLYILRIKNEELSDMEKVLEKIKLFLDSISS